jgi:hypothetical protein
MKYKLIIIVSIFSLQHIAACKKSGFLIRSDVGMFPQTKENVRLKMNEHNKFYTPVDDLSSGAIDGMIAAENILNARNLYNAGSISAFQFIRTVVEENKNYCKNAESQDQIIYLITGSFSN